MLYGSCQWNGAMSKTSSTMNQLLTYYTWFPSLFNILTKSISFILSRFIYVFTTHKLWVYNMAVRNWISFMVVKAFNTKIVTSASITELWTSCTWICYGISYISMAKYKTILNFGPYRGLCYRLNHFNPIIVRIFVLHVFIIIKS